MEIKELGCSSQSLIGMEAPDEYVTFPIVMSQSLIGMEAPVEELNRRIETYMSQSLIGMEAQ